MPYYNPRILDNGLSALVSEGNAIYLCSQEPTTYTQATSTYALARKTGITIGAIADQTPSGRKVAVPAVASGSPGEVIATGTATHYAIVDTVNSRLLVTGSMSASQALTNGNTFTTNGFDVGLVGPA